MDTKEYSKGVARTMKILKTSELNQEHMLLGIISEVGELADVFKKHIAYNENLDWINIQEELGDILFYVFGFCILHGFDFEKILEQNFSKLQVRYPEKYTDEKATNRNLEKEKQILTELGY